MDNLDNMDSISEIARLKEQVEAELDLCRRLYQLGDMLLYRLNKYEDTQRYDEMISKMVKEIGAFTFGQEKNDPTALI